MVPSSIWKFGCPTAGMVQGAVPIPMERVLLIAFWAAAITSSKFAPIEALAPPIFHIRTSPATPRRFSNSVLGAEAQSSFATTVFTSIPAFFAFFTAILTFMLSPA